MVGRKKNCRSSEVEITENNVVVRCFAVSLFPLPLPFASTSANRRFPCNESDGEGFMPHWMQFL